MSAAVEAEATEVELNDGDDQRLYDAAAAAEAGKPFLSRMHSADYIVARCPSVHVSTPVFCLNGYTYISFFHHRIDPPF